MNECKACGGTGKVCADIECRHIPFSKLTHKLEYNPDFNTHIPITCPACQDKPEKEKEYEEPCNSCTENTSSCPSYFSYSHDKKPVPKNCKGFKRKEKQLRVLCHWQHNIIDCRYELWINETSCIVAYVYLHNRRWYAVINGGSYYNDNNERVRCETEKEIKAAVEKALRIKRVEE